MTRVIWAITLLALVALTACSSAPKVYRKCKVVPEMGDTWVCEEY